MSKKTETQTIKGSETGTVPAEVIAAANQQAGTTTVQTATAENKAAKANAIFAECYAMSPVPQRKDILARVEKEAGLTPAGAATYLQNYKRKHGLSKAPATTQAAPEAPAGEAAKAE